MGHLEQLNRHGLPLLTCFIWLMVGILLADHATGEPLKRGEYIFRASGGCSCHTIPNTSGRRLAGGRSMQTPFGAIYSTNITPDLETGIGDWSETDFIKAMTRGVRPDGAHLFPVFPYTSFTQIKPQDLKDLFAYLKTVSPMNMENKDDELFFLFKWRFGLFFWKLLNFNQKPFQPTTGKSDKWNRGSYLVNALAHCSECHSPRDLSGGLKSNLLFSGSVDGPEGEFAPNITPDTQTGIGEWKKEAVTWFLQTGQKPDGDYTEGLMAEVINEGYQYLTQDDLLAMTEYILALEPIFNELKKK